ncbi:MAG: polyprenyl synthetase family protein [bacterium]|nr:polyprenyl synthetase family protein [bacterium]
MREIFLYPNLHVEQTIELSAAKASKHLGWYKRRLDPFLNSFLDEKLTEASTVHPEATVLVGEIRRFVAAGGKRVRPAFAYSAYTASGGRSLDAILYASAALELLHTFALIHDDIIDNADLRRGKPSAHKAFEDFHEKRGFEGSSSEFGVQVAILAGDLALAFADELLNTAPFPAERIRRAKNYYDLMKKQVIYGEYLDVLASNKGGVSEKDLLTILEYKTAKYTIERPLHIGAALAGADEESFQVFTDYGVPLGQAFQIQDDIMGTFSSEEKIGKPVDSDLREGKQTLLVIKAYEFSKGKDKQMLKKVIGNKKVGEEKIEKARDIIRNSGALEYSQKLSGVLIDRAKQAVYEAKLVGEGRQYLLEAADYLLTRSL